LPGKDVGATKGKKSENTIIKELANYYGYVEVDSPWRLSAHKNQKYNSHFLLESFHFPCRK
jgi:hypothetical protein